MLGNQFKFTESEKSKRFEISVWQYFYKEEIKGIQEISKKKVRYLEKVLSKDFEINDNTLTKKFQLIQSDVEAIERALSAMEGLFIAYMEHTSLLYDRCEYLEKKCGLLEGKWKGASFAMTQIRYAADKLRKENRLLKVNALAHERAR